VPFLASSDGALMLLRRATALRVVDAEALALV